MSTVIHSGSNGAQGMLWTANAHLSVEFEVVESLGLECKTLLTSVKDRVGTGAAKPNTAFCPRGTSVSQLAIQATVLNGIRGKHSRKPEEFYELVDQL